MMRRLAFSLPLFLGLALAGCESGGHFTIFGYSTQPNYDPCIKTVYVPIFKNKTYWRGMEFDMTRAVIKAIETKTPFKVVDDPNKADTELDGTVLTFTKNILNRNQLNEQRETETVMTVGIVWKDLRSGEILSQKKASPAGGPPFGDNPLVMNPPGTPPVAIVPGTPAPLNPPSPGSSPVVIGSAIPGKPAGPPQVIVTSVGGYIPEIGQSMASAQQLNVNRMATQIAALMEKPW